MTKAKHSSRRQTGDYYAMIPVEVLTSPAWRWLPHFARGTVTAAAGRFRGRNNGGLELTARDAAECGVRDHERKLGLALACAAGLLLQTVKPRQSQGKGTPAKYALTWQPMNHFPGYNIAAAEASNTWVAFTPPGPDLRSLRDAEHFLGWRDRSPAGRPPGRFLEGWRHDTPENGPRQRHDTPENASRQRHDTPTVGGTTRRPSAARHARGIITTAAARHARKSYAPVGVQSRQRYPMTRRAPWKRKPGSGHADPAQGTRLRPRPDG